MSNKIYVVDSENNERFYAFIDFILKGKRLSDKFFNDLKAEFLEKIEIEQAQGVDLTPYAKIEDLSIYAKSEDLANYALKSEILSLDDYALKSELPNLEPYALITDIKEVDLSPYAKTADLEPYAKSTDLEPYAKTADLSEFAKISELQAEISALKAVMHAYKELPASIETEIGANSRKNLQFEVPNIGGYTIMCFKQIAIQGISGNGDGWKNIVIQSFSTTGGGTKCNISLYNMGASNETVKLSVTAFCKKQGIA